MASSWIASTVILVDIPASLNQRLNIYIAHLIYTGFLSLLTLWNVSYFRRKTNRHCERMTWMSKLVISLEAGVYLHVWGFYQQWHSSNHIPSPKYMTRKRSNATHIWFFNEMDTGIYVVWWNLPICADTKVSVFSFNEDDFVFHNTQIRNGNIHGGKYYSFSVL